MTYPAAYPMTYPMTYPTNLYRLREERGIKRSFLADRSGVPIRTLEKLERGEQDINKTAAINVYQLAKVLGVDMVELLNIE